MSSLKLRRGLAGLGVFAIGGLGLLAPTAAIADPTPSPSVPVLNENQVTLEKTFISTKELDNNKTFTFTATPKPCHEDGCVQDVTKIPAWTLPSISFTDADFASTSSVKKTASVTLPALSKYTKPGVYAWEVKENLVESLIYSDSSRSYTVRAYVKMRETALVYDGITIEGDVFNPPVNSLDDPTGLEKKDSLDFYNVNAEEGRIVLKKKVVNSSGLPEESEYTLRLIISDIASNGRGMGSHYGSQLYVISEDYNFITNVVYYLSESGGGACVDNTVKANGVLFPKEVLDGDLDAYAQYAAALGIVAGGSGDAAKAVPLDTIECEVKIHADEEKEIVVPSELVYLVGATYTVEEIVPAGVKYTPTYQTVRSSSLYSDVTVDSAENQVIGNRGNVTTITNTYPPITPTGLVLEYLPYVLMVIVPLAGIAAYVAMRRKLLG